ncbi:MAG: iron(II)-dependent oxidoreductase [Gammaproteobacteria bacterium]|jgi:iron(II)-dependent oxidoreductase
MTRSAGTNARTATPYQNNSRGRSTDGVPARNYRASSASTSSGILAARLRRELAEVRAMTLRLIEPIDDHTIHAQLSPLMSPIVWDLGHIANFEALWLLTNLGRQGLRDDTLNAVYNPFENPRSARGQLSFLSREDVIAYMAAVRESVLEHLEICTFDSDNPLLHDGCVYWMIIQHETQHQETMLQALNLGGTNTPYPIEVLATGPEPAQLHGAHISHRDTLQRVTIDASQGWIGTRDRALAYDNERPAHQRAVPAFAIDRFPVTCGRFRAFIEDNGYTRRDLWSSAGWEWVQQTGHDAPQGWVRDCGLWFVERFGHHHEINALAPVQHVSFYEAEAFARWAGGRLPSEYEWETAARDSAKEVDEIYPWGNATPDAAHANLNIANFGPNSIGAHSAGKSAAGVEQLVGDTYEWTSSTFEGYQGYTSFPYEQYSEVFFGDEYRVLRGASWATSSHCARTSFRNWDFPMRRQIFAGFRMAWDV